MIGIGVEATLKGLNQVTKKLSQEELFRRARAATEETTIELYGEVVANTPTDTGRTRDRLFWEINGSTIQNLNGLVASPDQHFKVLEHGRTPGRAMPPARPIEEWADRHGIESRFIYVIRRAIGKRGLPAHNIMSDAIKSGRQHFGTVWLRRFIREAD